MSSTHNTSKPPLPPWRNPRWPQPPTARCSPSILDRPAPPPCHIQPDRKHMPIHQAWARARCLTSSRLRSCPATGCGSSGDATSSTPPKATHARAAAGSSFARLPSPSEGSTPLTRASPSSASSGAPTTTTTAATRSSTAPSAFPISRRSSVLPERHLLSVCPRSCHLSKDKVRVE